MTDKLISCKFSLSDVVRTVSTFVRRSSDIPVILDVPAPNFGSIVCESSSWESVHTLVRTSGEDWFEW